MEQKPLAGAAGRGVTAAAGMKLLVAFALELLVKDAGWRDNGLTKWYRRERNAEGKRTKHVVTELRELQAETAELLLGLDTQGVAAHGPEVGDRAADSHVVGRSVIIDVAGVGNLTLGG